MTNQLHTQLELSGETATLYLSGAIGQDDIARLCQECTALPASIRTLRLDLHSLTRVGADAMDAVRVLLRHWRASRRGHFRLSFSTPNMLATLTDGDTARSGMPTAWAPPRLNDAMTATYL